MAAKRKFWDTAILHPVLFAIYPLLALWAANSDQTPFVAVSRAAFIVLLFLLASMAASLVIFRSWVKAAVLTSLFMLFFLTYGHIYPYIDKVTVFGFMVGRHRFLIALSFGLLGLASLVMLRSKTAPYSLNRIFNIVSLALFAFIVLQIGMVGIRSGIQQPVTQGVSQSKAESAAAASIEGPDVYYIVLDGYSRDDLLRRLRWGPDVSGFLQELEDLGFYVANCAQSNYDRTNLSLASSLNMNYLEGLGVQYSPDETRSDASRYEQLLKHSLVRQKFEQMGYNSVTFKAVYAWVDITDSDFYINSEEVTPFYNRLEVVNFQYLFLSTTLLRPVIEAQTAAPAVLDRMPVFVLQLLYPKADLFSTREYKQYEQNLYALQKLSEAPALPGKKFVYAHLFITHQPYVFNPDGSFRWPPKDDDQAYFAQIEYINKRLPEILRQILRDSITPPVIIIQGDHGYTFEPHRVQILSAYYLPDGGEQDLYPTVTPVNTFRMIFNRYFGENNALLPDRSFHSPRGFPYRFEEVPATCSEPAN